MDISTETKSINLEAQLDETIQSQVTSEHSGVSIHNFLMRSGELVSPWWSTQRDFDLRRFVMQSDHFLGAIYKVTTKLQSIKPVILPRDPTVKAHIAAAERFNSLLIEGSEFNEGWPVFFSKYLWDLFTQDNGTFTEIIGDGPADGPIQGPALGLASLDSARCQRTNNVEFPVIYTDVSGQRFKLHHTRVIAVAQLPSTSAEMFGVGRCWVTRAINVTQNIVDILLYKQEKLGSRPLRQILIGKGISATQIFDAIMMANESMDNMGLRRYAKSVVIGSQTNTDIDIDIKDLASLPDGFDEQTSIELGMFAIALAGGFPPRDLWPATTTGATRADALFQHIVGGSGYQAILDQVMFSLGGSPNGLRHFAGKFLPPTLKIEFDFVDDDQDERQSTIKQRRAETREIDINDGVIDIRTARQQALRSSDITESEFNRMELQDGRLPSGLSALSLFFSGDKFVMELLSLSISEPLNIELNKDNIEFILERIDDRIANAQIIEVNAPTAMRKNQASQAIRALEMLRELYIGTVEVEDEIVEDEGGDSLDDPCPEGQARNEETGECE